MHLTSRIQQPWRMININIRLFRAALTNNLMSKTLFVSLNWNAGGLSMVDTQRWSSTCSSLPELSPRVLNPNTTELMATQTSMTERMMSRELMPFRSTWKVTQIRRVVLLLCAVCINDVLLTMISVPTTEVQEQGCCSCTSVIVAEQWICLSGSSS